MYVTAMIVCCNDLAMTEEDGLSESDADWMKANVTVVQLPSDETWFSAPKPQQRSVAGPGGSERASSGRVS